MKPLEQLVRPNILSLAPYSSARNEYSGKKAHVFLDANENPYNSPLNRYPDPLQLELKELISKVKEVKAENIFLGNGSDEAIDLPYRCFCRPGKDNVVAIEPTYGMYKVCADINDVEYRPVLLDENFQFHADELLAACDDNTKLIWLCSPNNPTGNNLNIEEILKVINKFEGIVIVDEAYSDFSRQKSLRSELAKYPNLIVLNTMSKAWGSAAIRLGMQEAAMKILDNREDVSKWVSMLLQERAQLMEAFKQLPICEKVYPSDANFFLAKMTDAQAIYDYLVDQGIIVRNRTRIKLCNNCLRVTIGTRSENSELIGALRQYK